MVRKPRGLMRPSLNDIELFVEVARSHGFTRAGDVLGMPPSTLSRHLTALEKSIGVRLLNRSTREIALTEAGAAYFERCQAIVEQARMAHELLLSATREPRGRLRVSLPSSLALAFLQSTLYEFSRRYPEIECEYDLSVRKIDLQTDGFDVVIRAARPSDSGIVSHRLGTLLLGLYAAPDYLRDHGQPEKPEDLAAHECLRTSAGRDDSSWHLISSTGEQRTVRVRGRMAMNHVLLLRHMAAMGAGIIPLSVYADQVDGHMVRILPEWTFAPVPLMALFPSRLMPARVRVFIDLLGERLTHVGILTSPAPAA